MILKNIDKCGLDKDINGKVSFCNKIMFPKDVAVSDKGIAAVSSFTKSMSSKVESAINKSTKVENKNQATTKVENKNQNKFKVESAYLGYADYNGINGITGTAISSMTPYLRVLDGILAEDDWITKRKIFEDIYTYDIAGAVVDIISSLPFSDFNLIGLDDKSMIDGYLKAISDIPFTSLLPSITTDYLVNGAFCGSLNWDDINHKFTYLMPHHLDDLDLYNLDLFGYEPIIDLKLSNDTLEIINNNDDRIKRILDNAPSYIKELKNGGVIKLNPLLTLYIPRRGLSSAWQGSSYFNRILTIHMVEKSLIRGTIVSAQRRQRAIMHIQAGTDDWEPTNEELNDLVNYFQSADLDPISGIVVTRNGVNISDVKAGADFWNWTDIFDFASNAKMRALGVNESILSADASFNTLEASLSLFIDGIYNVRKTMTDAIFTNKLFPIIANKNGYYKKKDDRSSEVLGSINSIYELGDISQYAIPTVQWEKQLKPKADKDYLDILNALKEEGVPISLRMMAAAGGENIDDLVDSMRDDNELRLKIAENKKDLIDDAVKDKTTKFLGIEDIDDLIPINEETSNEDYTLSKVKSYANINKGIVNNSKKFRNLENLDEIYGVREYDDQGHRRLLTKNQKNKLEDKIHKQTAEVLSNLNYEKK